MCGDDTGHMIGIDTVGEARYYRLKTMAPKKNYQFLRVSGR